MSGQGIGGHEVACCCQVCVMYRHGEFSLNANAQAQMQGCSLQAQQLGQQGLQQQAASNQLEAQTVTVPCHRCGAHTRFPLGMLDPEQGKCSHVLRVCDWDGLACVCGLKVSGEMMLAAGFRRSAPRDRDGMLLADRLQVLADENVVLLAENARLRRELERSKKR